MPLVSFYRSKYDNANVQKAENILSFNAWVGNATGNVINFNNFLNGFVANNNARYYKTVKKTMYLCEFCNFDN